MQKKFYLPLLIAISLQLAACAGSKRKPPGGAEVMGPEYQGPAIEEQSVTEEDVEAYGPPAEEAPIAPPPSVAAEGPKMCLILGPGMAKALAHAAVLEAIRKAQLPVHCVVGTEMGAVVGAMYAQAKGNTNSLQWQLFKLNKETYFNFPLLSLRDPKSSGQKLHDFLRDVFRNKNIEDLPIRFATAATDLDRDTTIPFERGNLADALSATLAMPGIFETWPVDGENLASGAVSSPAPIDIARNLGGSFFVLVDVIEDMSGAPRSNARYQKAFFSARNLIRLQKRDASFVIQVKAGSIPFDDFSRQGEILAVGARAAEKSVPELKAAWEKLLAGK
jgi:NTE family protein